MATKKVNENAKLKVGDEVIFLGSKGSEYGYRSWSDKLIGSFVTIKDVHHYADPPAYLIAQDEAVFWYAEECFEVIALDNLPEFESSDSGVLFALFA